MNRLPAKEMSKSERFPSRDERRVERRLPFFFFFFSFSFSFFFLTVNLNIRSRMESCIGHLWIFYANGCKIYVKRISLRAITSRAQRKQARDISFFSSSSREREGEGERERERESERESERVGGRERERDGKCVSRLKAERESL